MYRYQNRKSKSFILKKIALILLVVVPIIGIAFVCNTVVAKYTGSVSQKLTFIAYPNNAYNYYVYDANGARTNAYESATSIKETIKVCSDPVNTVFQIKIPATEEGYYNLSFMVDFQNSTKSEADLECVTTMAYPVGCKVVHQSTHPFGQSSSRLYLATNNTTQSTNGIQVQHSTKNTWAADDNYMWKTLAPSLAERVDLTYKVTSADITAGYVIWAWQFSGLTGNATYTLTLDEIDIKKINGLDSDDPYFDFTQTQYVNNTVDQDSCSVAGYTRNVQGKGTYVTSATTDSMTMQVAPLYAAWNYSGEQETIWSDLTGGGLTGSYKEGDGYYQNYVGINVPLKNIKYDTSYKVTFDLSLARQGTRDTHTKPTEPADILYSDDYGSFLWILGSKNYGRTLHFQSYIHSGLITDRKLKTHANAGTTNGRGQITMANARYSPHELTRYDELRVLNVGNSHTDILYNSSQSINSLTTQNGGNINFLNMVRHTETNGQNTINWLTFYNTTYTFNISSSLNEGKNLSLDDLYWVWAIDALRPGRWFRFKFENVRIEEVEQYGSNINKNGIKIAGTQVAGFNEYSASQNEETYLRGANGTGQNYQALQGTTRSNGGTAPGIPMASYNTFGPIYDASNYAIAVGATDSAGNLVKGANDYKIYLDGYCVVKGGVDKYVWSADGGETWHDMIIETPLGEADISTLAYAERRVDQAQYATIDTTEYYYATKPSHFDSDLINESVDSSGYRTEAKNHTNDYADFVKADAGNAVFTGFRMYADLSAYANTYDMDVIFAAVPKKNSEARCELLRITHLNKSVGYRAVINKIASDITVTTTYGSYGSSAPAKYLNATKDYTSGTTTWETSCYTQSFPMAKGVNINNVVTTHEGYASTTNPDSLKEIKPLMSGMPVKTTMQLLGWNMCVGGTDGYYWTVDDGKTWTKCEGTPATGTESSINNQVFWWLNGRAVTTADQTNTLFNNVDRSLYVDLSDYVGQVVTLVVAAKPVGKMQFCPVAKVNSVAVYGDRVFYTRPRTVTVGGTSLTGITSYGNLKFNDASNHLSAQSYSIFEPYNVDLYATRKLTSYVVEVNNGDLISIDGFLMCKGGVKEYKYTVDGGKTWTSIWQRSYDSNGNIVKDFIGPNEGICKAGALISLDFDNSQYANSNFSTGHGATKTLDFNLNTAFTQNTECSLLVAAVADDGNDSLIPVIHLDINLIV